MAPLLVCYCGGDIISLLNVESLNKSSNIVLIDYDGLLKSNGPFQDNTLLFLLGLSRVGLDLVLVSNKDNIVLSNICRGLKVMGVNVVGFSYKGKFTSLD